VVQLGRKISAEKATQLVVTSLIGTRTAPRTNDCVVQAYEGGGGWRNGAQAVCGDWGINVRPSFRRSRPSTTRLSDSEVPGGEGRVGSSRMMMQAFARNERRASESDPLPPRARRTRG